MKARRKSFEEKDASRRLDEGQTGDPLDDILELEQRALHERDSHLDTEEDFGLEAAIKRHQRTTGAIQQVDLHSEAAYGEDIFLHPGLQDGPRENYRQEDDSGRLREALEDNDRLRAENLRLRAEIARLGGELPIVDSETPSGTRTVESVVSETRSGLEDFPEVDLSEIPLFAGARGADPMAHLQIHYGQWLKYFGASRDMVWLPQVRKHDIKLVKALQNYINRRDIAGLPRAVGEIIPTQSQLGDALLRGKTVEEVMQNPRLAHLLHARLQNALYLKQQQEKRKLMPSRRKKK